MVAACNLISATGGMHRVDLDPTTDGDSSKVRGVDYDAFSGKHELLHANMREANAHRNSPTHYWMSSEALNGGTRLQQLSKAMWRQWSPREVAKSKVS